MRRIAHSEQRQVLSGVLDLQLVGSVDAESADLRRVECATSVAGATPAPELVKFGGNWWNWRGVCPFRPPGLSEVPSSALSQMRLCTFWVALFLSSSSTQEVRDNVGNTQRGKATGPASTVSTCSKGPAWSPKAQLPSNQGKRPEGWG